MTFGIDPTKLIELKALLRQSQQKLVQFIQENESNSEEVYQFNSQLFPLTKSEIRK